MAEPPGFCVYGDTYDPYPGSNLSKFEKERYANGNKIYWNRFYKCKKNKFFKNRHYLEKEFPELLQQNLIILEVGCGVGDSLYPLLEVNPTLKFISFDISKVAVKLVEEDPRYDAKKILTFVWNGMDLPTVTTNESLATSKQFKILRKLLEHGVTTDKLPEAIENGVNLIDDLLHNFFPPPVISEANLFAGADLAIIIFVLSAIQPQDHDKLIGCVSNLIATGGVVLFRDYAFDDMAMRRFELKKNLTKVEDGYYIRGDHTLALFFKVDYIISLFERHNYELLGCMVMERKVTNVKEQKDMSRSFIQGKFKKR